jgi:hypothetical protein
MRVGRGEKVTDEMSGKVMALRPKERVRLDAEPIAAIYRDLGTTAAEQIVARALAEIALTMAALAEQVRLRNLTDLARQLRRLQRMAEHLGMVSLGQIYVEVRTCLERGDATAFAAVWARLIRIAERSLATDKDLMDQRV